MIGGTGSDVGCVFAYQHGYVFCGVVSGSVICVYGIQYIFGF